MILFQIVNIKYNTRHMYFKTAYKLFLVKRGADDARREIVFSLMALKFKTTYIS